jgi:hypothetical protein
MVLQPNTSGGLGIAGKTPHFRFGPTIRIEWRAHRSETGIENPAVGGQQLGWPERSVGQPGC